MEEDTVYVTREGRGKNGSKKLHWGHLKQNICNFSSRHLNVPGLMESGRRKLN